MRRNLPFHQMEVTESMRLEEGISIREIKREDGKIELVLIIRDRTTKDGIVAGWSKIKNYRNEIHKIQPKKMSLASYTFLEEYALKHDNGWSYADIAKEINYHSIMYMCDYVDWMRLEKRITCSSRGTILFTQMAIAMRLKSDFYYEWLPFAVEDIQVGRAPWMIEDGPIKTKKVTYILGLFNKEREKLNKYQKIPPGEHDPNMKILNELYSEGYNDKANELLERTFSDSWEKNKDKIGEWLKNR